MLHYSPNLSKTKLTKQGAKTNLIQSMGLYGNDWAAKLELSVSMPHKVQLCWGFWKWAISLPQIVIRAYQLFSAFSLIIAIRAISLPQIAFGFISSLTSLVYKSA